MAVTAEQIEKAVGLAKAYGASRVTLFASATEDPGRARDLDLACNGVPGWKLFELGARLEEGLHLLVDVVPLDPPTPFSRHIEKEGRVLL
ncbi:MAG: nucleotidyltransferase family protein [Deferrisomatales bacterium]